MSINISLNSFMNGGRTSIEIENIKKNIPIRTINKDANLGSLKIFCIWLHKLQTTFDITKEQITNSIKSLKVHTNKRLITTTENLK